MELIYLDNAATTKPNINLLEICSKYSAENFYNPSALYRPARKVKELLTENRNKILNYFPNHNLIFTSCGTEADNTAIFGFFKRGNAVTTMGEHSAVFQAFETLRAKGMNVRYAKLNKDGSVNEKSLLELVDENTTFVSVVHVNNETGAINDISRLAKLVKAKAKRAIFHSDGVQAFCKIPYKISSDVDLYSVSAHKIHALKGVGGLFYKKGLNLPAYLIGGGQENGLRSGTENLLGIYHFALCVEELYPKIEENYEKIKGLKERFINGLDEKIKVISSSQASPYVVSITCSNLRGEVLQHLLEDDGVLVGTGSACSSKHPHSRVLKACGYTSGELDGVLRISFSVENNAGEIDFAVETINKAVNKLYKVVNKK